MQRETVFFLYELREPTEADWEGKVKDIVIRLGFFFS